VIHHSDQRLQREAHGDVRFPVETPMASHRKDVLGAAAQGKAIQSNADRGLATDLFPGRFGPSATQRQGVHGIAAHCNAAQRISKQRGSGFGNRPFSGPLWSVCLGGQWLEDKP